MSCNASLAWPESSLCNGHGVCEAFGCVCNSGWRANIDFLNLSESDCSVSHVAITVLYSLSLMFGLATMVYFPRVLMLVWSRSVSKSRTVHSPQGNAYLSSS